MSEFDYAAPAATNATPSTEPAAPAWVRGAWAGAAAGVVAALMDYGALWLWLPLWGDRAALLARQLATLVPLGGLFGALLLAWDRVAGLVVDRAAHRLGGAGGARTDLWRARLWPLPHTALAAAPLAVVAHLLFTGGRTSRLPLRPLLVVLTAIVLVAGAAVGLRAARAAWKRSGRSRRGRLAAPLLALGAAFGLGKIDQHVLPNLYEYLHTTLAVCVMLGSGAAACLAARAASGPGGLLSRSPRLAHCLTRLLRPAAGGALGLVLASAFGLHLWTLDGNQNVRVALFDTRGATTRAAMRAVVPLVDGARRGSSKGALAARAAARERKVALAGLTGLPEAPGAHVVLVTVDALRADRLGTYGYTRRDHPRNITPHLDALAAEGVVFERAYCAAPHSSYALSSLMTSEYLHETLDLGQPAPEATLPRALAAAGYHTAAFYTLGIFHTEGERLARYRDDAFGFALHDHTDRAAAPTTDRVLAEVDRVVAEGERPTFFWAHYFDVHEPYEETALGTSDSDRYDGEVLKTDREIGRLLEGMRARLRGDLIVVVASDHGEEFRDHGGVYHGSSLYEEQARIPLIVAAPGVAPRRVAAPVKSVDIAPTVLGLVGVAAPATFRGHDLRGLMTGHVSDVGPAFAAVLTKRMVVRFPYKLIADLRFNTAELYDLGNDPRERENLASRRPELVESLRDEIYGWLDGLGAPAVEGAPSDPRRLALNRGRLGDRRAVPELAALARDTTADVAARREACRMLGRLSDARASEALVDALDGDEPVVAAEAAIALGRMVDARAREALRDLVNSEDPDLRTRAAVSLARLRDPHAVPALIEALWLAETAYDREESVRWLGRLRDARALEPLLGLIPEFRTRHLVAVALGQLGDPRAYEPLVDMLAWETRSNIRDNVVQGLGQLGDARAIPRIVELAVSEPDLSYTGESLVRLGAIERGAIGGADVGPALRGAAGLGRCSAAPWLHDWNYLHRTVCETTADEVAIPLAVPASVATAGDVDVLLSLRRLEPVSASLEVDVVVGTADARTVRVSSAFSQPRFTLTRGSWRTGGPGRTRAVLRVREPGARLVVDHVLLVPHPTELAAVDGTH
jgi:arylsulfatase A-like enzyme/HEAT repeat protein